MPREWWMVRPILALGCDSHLDGRDELGPTRRDETRPEPRDTARPETSFALVSGCGLALAEVSGAA
jgi:hypothetical protein